MFSLSIVFLIDPILMNIHELLLLWGSLFLIVNLTKNNNIWNPSITTGKVKLAHVYVLIKSKSETYFNRTKWMNEQIIWFNKASFTRRNTFTFSHLLYYSFSIPHTNQTLTFCDAFKLISFSKRNAFVKLCQIEK